jgi:hypothetical protein
MAGIHGPREGAKEEDMEIYLDCTYRLFPGEPAWALPWGVAHIGTWTRVSGHPRSSRAGAWYFKAPAFSFIGYGQYQPYLEFLFKGAVERTKRRDDIPGDGAGFRVGERTWLYFRGQFRPTPRALLEQRLSIRYRYDLTTADEVLPLVGTQGHLTLRSLSWSGEDNIATLRLMERIAGSCRLREVFPHRRKIFNHQFFGMDVRVYHLPHVPEVHGEPMDPDQLQWVVWVPEEADVVSPDHLDQPLRLASGLYWAAHPHPTPGKGVD